MIHSETLNMFLCLIALYGKIIIDSIDIDLTMYQSFKHLCNLYNRNIKLDLFIYLFIYLFISLPEDIFSLCWRQRKGERETPM